MNENEYEGLRREENKQLLMAMTHEKLVEFVLDVLENEAALRRQLDKHEDVIR